MVVRSVFLDLLSGHVLRCVVLYCATLSRAEQSSSESSRVEWAFFLAVVDMWQSVKNSTMKCRGVHSPAIICTTTRAMLI